jgi:hypothetical protein
MRSNHEKTVVRIAWWCLALLSAALLCAACGDDDSGGGDAGSDTDTDSDSDTGATGTLTVSVLSHSWDADPAPAAGALVTLDKPGGERVALTAGADGTVAFDGIDWSLGEAAVTASMDGHGMASRVGIVETDGAITLRIPVQPVETVTLSGTVTNMTDESNSLISNYYGCGGTSYQGPGPDYSIEVPAGAPFAMDIFEYSWEALPSGQGQEWTVQDVYWQEMDAITADTTNDITIDGDGGVETYEASGSFDFSLTEGTPLSGTEGMGGVYVMTACDNYPVWLDGAGWLGNGLGWTSHSDINADGTAFDYTVGYFTPPFVDQYFTLYFVWGNSGWTEVREDGLPTAGSHAIDLLDVPVVNTSSETGFVELNGAPVTWESAETDARPELVVFVGDYTWIIDGPVSATSLAVPALPEGAALTEPIETNVHEANLILLRDAAESTPELWLGARAYSVPVAVEYVP